MATTKIRSSSIEDGQVAIEDIAGSAAAAAGTFLKQDGTWAEVATDTTTIEDDIALLGFKVAVAGSMAKYNLVDQTEDAFIDQTGVDAGDSTAALWNAAKYFSGTVSATLPTGGAITTDGSYTVHTFLADGVFTTYAPADVDYLIVAGGGGGGSTAGTGWPGAGGGGGGFRTDTGFATTAQAYTITVGDGGAAGTTGDPSIFSTITSAGGGRGGYGNYPGAGQAGADGGSGGGGGQSLAPANAGGASAPVTSPVQGYAGAYSGFYYAGGGGGAGAVGSSGTGGVGAASAYSGASVTYSAGGNGTGSVAGSANTGDGGDGTASTGKVGGSGIVIIRFLDGSYTSISNMTLVSEFTEAEVTPTKGDLVMTYTDGAGTASVNTDLKAYASRDDGSTWTQLTLTEQGSTGSHFIVSAHDVDISSQPTDKTMRYKIETLNQSALKETRIQAVSLGWS